MIARLQGLLLEKQPPNLLVDIRGVGYDVLAPMSTFYQLPELKHEVVLHIHFSVTENSQQLFGFISKEDRSVFRLLIKVNGVGPKMALGVMSGMEVHDLIRCVKDNDVNALVKVPGVGKKTAERLIIETRDKFKDWQIATGPGSQSTPNQELSLSGSAMTSDAESALVALGYKPADAAKAISKTLESCRLAGQPANTSEALIRLALRNMMP